MNALYAIRPYIFSGRWVFDDPAHGLQAEPFVAGVDLMIDLLTADIPNAESGFLLTFSADPFPGAVGCLKRSGPGEFGGTWYRTNLRGQRMHGWLCAALLRFFDQPPDRLYAAVSPARPEVANALRWSEEV